MLPSTLVSPLRRRLRANGHLSQVLVRLSLFCSWRRPAGQIVVIELTLIGHTCSLQQ